MSKKYDLNDVVNHLPNLMADPIGSLTSFLEYCDKNKNTNETPRTKNESLNTNCQNKTEDKELQELLRAEEEIRKKKEELLNKNKTLKQQLKEATKEIEDGSNNFNKLYELIERVTH